MSTPDDDFEPAQPVVPAKAPPADAPLVIDGDWDGAHPVAAVHSDRPILSTEQYLIGCCVVDEGATLDRCIEAGLTASDLTTPELGLILSTLRKMRAAGTPVALDTLVESLGPRITDAGGIHALMALDQVGTTTHASHSLAKVLELSERRRVDRIARQVQELTAKRAPMEDITALVDSLKPRARRKSAPHRTPFSFQIPAAKDHSILLGNRYLNRGDGMVIVSSSGMGKSSMSHQMAGDWALGHAFHGIAPNGVPEQDGGLRILIVQSEDSDGDIAEVWQSLKHAKGWTDAQIATLNRNIRIISERSLRGTRFLAWLALEIAAFAPDIVMLNPLQAFIDGDVTDSKDLGAFLREGLNGINAESKFGYVIVHHTTKPSTGKDRQDRQWHEVMYDMAGGAEIINWARGIISLRATPQEGVFKLVLAKRGRRAGVMREVEQGTGVRLEIVTQIGLKHARGIIPGTQAGLICWEGCELEAEEQEQPKAHRGGRATKHHFSDVRSIFPPKDSKGLPLNELHRLIESNMPITRPQLHGVLKRWGDEGDVEILRPEGQAMRYRAAL